MYFGMQIKFSNFVLLISLFTLKGKAQDLHQSAQAYFLKNHFSYNPDSIAGNKIKSIEKKVHYYYQDSLTNKFIIEKHLFNPNGKPSYVYHKEVAQNQSEIYYFYDSLGNLIKEVRYGIAPSLQYKVIATYEWTYTGKTLTGQRYYVLEDHFDVEKGATYFPEKIFLYRLDSLEYLYQKKQVIIHSNHLSNRNGIKAEPYPANFKTPFTTTLTFHSNGILATQKLVRGEIIQTHQYNECGHDLSSRLPNPKCMELTGNSNPCVPSEKLYLCNLADTITFNNQLVFYVRNSFSNFQHDSGPGWWINQSGIAYYNQDFRPVFQVDTTNRVRGPSKDNFPSFSSQTIRKSSFDYYRNGILKKISITDEFGKLLETTEVKLEHYPD